MPTEITVFLYPRSIRFPHGHIEARFLKPGSEFPDERYIVVASRVSLTEDELNFFYATHTVGSYNNLIEEHNINIHEHKLVLTTNKSQEELWGWVQGKNEDFTYALLGNNCVDMVKSFLDFADIAYDQQSLLNKIGSCMATILSTCFCRGVVPFLPCMLLCRCSVCTLPVKNIGIPRKFFDGLAKTQQELKAIRPGSSSQSQIVPLALAARGGNGSESKDTSDDDKGAGLGDYNRRIVRDLPRL